MKTKKNIKEEKYYILKICFTEFMCWTFFLQSKNAEKRDCAGELSHEGSHEWVDEFIIRPGLLS